MAILFGVISKKYLPNLRPQRVSPLLSFRSYMFVALTFRLTMHLELRFVYSVN